MGPALCHMGSSGSGHQVPRLSHTHPCSLESQEGDKVQAPNLKAFHNLQNNSERELAVTAAPSQNSAMVPKASPGSPPSLPGSPHLPLGLAWSPPSFACFSSQFPRVSCRPTRQQTLLSLGLFSSPLFPQRNRGGGSGGTQQVRWAGRRRWLIDGTPCVARG